MPPLAVIVTRADVPPLRYCHAGRQEVETDTQPMQTLLVLVNLWVSPTAQGLQKASNLALLGHRTYWGIALGGELLSSACIPVWLRSFDGLRDAKNLRTSVFCLVLKAPNQKMYTGMGLCSTGPP